MVLPDDDDDEVVVLACGECRIEEGDDIEADLN